MPSWYDIVGLDSRSNESCEGLDDSMDKILDLIQEQVTTDNIDYSRIVLAGFSQGGALALYTGMTCAKVGEKRGLGLAGIVLMSGYLPRASSFQIAEGSQSTPILHCHGREDPMVMVDAVQLSKNRVLEMGGADYETKIYPGLDHSVSMDELEDVTEFLQKVIPPKNGDEL
jgi:lysophospholipase-2